MADEKNEEQDSDDGAAAREEPPPLWEWIVAGVGLLLLVGTLGYLGWQAVAAGHRPPQPRVEVMEVLPQEGRFLVRVRVRNAGDLTAEGLKVRGSLQQGEGAAEESETEFDFLPGRSEREAGLYFTRDPRAGRLELRAESYRKP